MAVKEVGHGNCLNQEGVQGGPVQLEGRGCVHLLAGLSMRCSCGRLDLHPISVSVRLKDDGCMLIKFNSRVYKRLGPLQALQ